MGGVDDDEPPPPLKRPRTSSSELVQLSNGSSLIEPVSGSWRDLMSRGEDDDMVGSSGVIKRREFVRIIANALYSLGYKKSGALLEEESGIPLHSSVVNLFIQQILDGNWDESVVTLCKIDMLDENVVKEACLLIFEQKLFEHLDNDNVMEALKTLRIEIAPLCVNKNKVRELSVSVLYPANVVGGSNCGPRLKAKTRSALLEELQALLPANIMIPEKRLEHLIEQAFRLQRDACRFHNSLDKEMSLYTDHHCGRDQIPSQTLQILEAHNDEVWFLRFSHNGKYLASSSNDKSAIIWEVEKNGAVLKHKLVGHEKAISSVSWSPDDRQLLSCGDEEAVRRWDVSSGECVGVYEKAGLGMVSCGWSPDGKWVFSGVNDRSICTWDLEGKETECWKGQRTLKISDLEVTGDGRRIISMGKDNAILLFDRETKAERVIEEEQTITSFSLSGDSKFLLVSLLSQELHLWNIDGDAFLVTKYRGHKRSRFVIKSCFGGLKQAFVASGSEDSQVYIWHRGSGELIEALPGHSGAVNCVSWNPADPHMLASGSDDRTVRIWGLNGIDFGVQCNGSSRRCNGRS